MPGITRKLELRIAGEASTLSAPLNLYRGDRGIDIFFRIMDFSYDFTGTNLLRNIGSARYNAIVVKPDGSNYVTPTQPIVDNEVKFTITKDLTDEMTEIGTYTLQFLLHGTGDSRVAIPPITIEVKELIADVADGADGQANYSTTNKTTIKAGQATIEARWGIGELITADKLNYTRDKAIQGAETSQANSNKISVLEPKVATLEKKITPLQTDVNILKEKVGDFQNINVMNQEATGVGNISLSDTYDGVTKDLTVKGKTYINLIKSKQGQGVIQYNSNLKCWVNSGGKLSGGILCSNRYLKPNTNYTLVYNIAKTISNATLSLDSHSDYASNSKALPKTAGTHKVLFSTKESFDSIREGFIIKIHTRSELDSTEKDSIIIGDDITILEGDYTNKPIPNTHFDSITSSGEQEDNKIKIKSTGKNLFNEQFEQGHWYYATGNKLTKVTSPTGFRCANPIKILPNTKYITDFKNNGTGGYFILADSQMIITRAIDFGVMNNSKTIETTNKEHYLAFYSVDESTRGYEITQIEEGSIATNYEPYMADFKTIKLPFDNGLKSLSNDIRDEIQNKQITQRIGRIVLNGSENWSISYNNVGDVRLIRYVCRGLVNYSSYKEIADNFPTGKSYWSYDERGLYIGGNNNLAICFKSTDSEYSYSLEQFKAWLKENPVTVYYELAQPIIHPLYEDYSLRTYQGVTHLYQENNICGEMKVSAPSNRDGIIHSNTMEIVELNDKLEQTFDYLGGKIPVYVPESFEGYTTIKDSMVGETQQLSVKGRTLQNLLGFTGIEFDSNNNRLALRNTNNKGLFKNTTYTLINTNSKPVRFTIDKASINSYLRGVDVAGGTSQKITLNEDEYVAILFGNVKDGWANDETSKNQLKTSCIILEGDWTNYNIPYFEGITSTGEQEDNKIKIRSVGKNLFNKNDVVISKNIYPVDGSLLKDRNSVIIKVTENTSYSCNIDNAHIAFLSDFKDFTDNGYTFISGVFDQGAKKFTTPPKARYMTVGVQPDVDLNIIQIEEGTKATNYEPYIENYKEITLPFEGGLKSLPNGECDSYKNGVIIQRLHKMLIPHTWDFIPYASAPNQTKTIVFYMSTSNLSYAWGGNWNNMLSNRFINKNVYNIDEEGVAIDSKYRLVFRISRDKLATQDAAGFKKWLQANETYVIGKLLTPKTYILEGERGLNSYEDVTHFFQENNIVTNIKMLAPISLNKSIGRVQYENASLTKENWILKEDNKIVAEALLNIMQPINTLDEKGEEYKPHTQEEIINRLIEILSR